MNIQGESIPLELTEKDIRQMHKKLEKLGNRMELQTLLLNAKHGTKNEKKRARKQLRKRK